MLDRSLVKFMDFRDRIVGKFRDRIGDGFFFLHAAIL